MDRTRPLSPRLPSPPPNRARRDGFFAHHGPWAPGVRLFRQLHFRAKALIISMALVLPLLGLIAWQLQQQWQQGMAARQAAVRHHVEIAHAMLTWAHGLERDGRVSREQAQALARGAIGGMRYDGNEYFWINDLHPRVVMHPIRPELDGRDATDIRDPNGLALFQAFARTARTEGAGYVAYQWPRPGDDTPVDKLAYVQGFEPWGWVIGSGLYVDDVQAAARRAVMVDAAVVAASLAVAGYLFASFYRVMDGGLRETRRHLRAMTDGDLTSSPTPWGRDDAAVLMLDLRRMQEALRSMVRQVHASSAQIVVASREISAGAHDLSARTEQSAANLEQTASAMEQISATLQSSADHTREASAVAEGNATGADDGGRTVQRVVETMDAIRDASARIGDITATIDGLAFQSDILALNAAVEAARAGEHGRGFAVVAAEVRALAQRSAAASREIRGLIGDTVERIGDGARVADEAGARMREIVDGSRRVRDLLADIAGGAREQAQGVEQVGSAIGELDRMTQQNAALVEQTAAAASAMHRQAEVLAAEVGRFRLPAGDAAVPA